MLLSAVIYGMSSLSFFMHLALRWCRVFIGKFAIPWASSCPWWFSHLKGPSEMPQLLKDLVCLNIARIYHHSNSNILLEVRETNLFFLHPPSFFFFNSLFQRSYFSLLPFLQKVSSSRLRRPFLFRQLTDSFPLPPHTTYGIGLLVVAQSLNFTVKVLMNGA